MKHWTEKAISRSLQAFAEDMGVEDFQLNSRGVGPDAFGRKDGETVWFEIKACKDRVTDISKYSGDRPGRFRINPRQYPECYGTPRLWYALVVYEDNGHKDKRIVQVRYVRSDKLPQRSTVISLTAIKD